MKARFEIGKACDQYIAELRKAGEDTEKVAKKMIYKGAEYAIVKTKEAWSNAPRDPSYQVKDLTKPPKNALKIEKHKGLTEEQLRGLIRCTGISRMEDSNGYINTELGVDGYMPEYRTYRYPNGYPALLMARALESGSKYRDPCPVMKKAVRSMRRTTEKIMEREFFKYLEERKL